MILWLELQGVLTDVRRLPVFHLMHFQIKSRDGGQVTIKVTIAICRPGHPLSQLQKMRNEFLEGPRGITSAQHLSMSPVSTKKIMENEENISTVCPYIKRTGSRAISSLPHGYSGFNR